METDSYTLQTVQSESTGMNHKLIERESRLHIRWEIMHHNFCVIFYAAPIRIEQHVYKPMIIAQFTVVSLKSNFNGIRSLKIGQMIYLMSNEQRVILSTLINISNQILWNDV